jgi:hypothetical protein
MPVVRLVRVEVLPAEDQALLDHGLAFIFILSNGSFRLIFSSARGC